MVLCGLLDLFTTVKMSSNSSFSYSTSAYSKDRDAKAIKSTVITE